MISPLATAMQLQETGTNEKRNSPGNLGNGAPRQTGDLEHGRFHCQEFRARRALQHPVQADMFNSTNHVNYNGPNAGFNNATFGEISGAGGMRVIQLNAKLSF